MNPTILGVIGPGFLNQVPTLDDTTITTKISVWNHKPLVPNPVH